MYSIVIIFRTFIAGVCVAVSVGGSPRQSMRYLLGLCSDHPSHYATDCDDHRPQTSVAALGGLAGPPGVIDGNRTVSSLIVPLYLPSNDLTASPPR